MPAHDPAGPETTDAPEAVIAGAGPSGLMLACELALAGIRTVALERRTQPGDAALGEPLGAAARLFDHRGLHVRLTEAPGTAVATLAERAADLGVEIRRGHELVGLTQDHAAVTVEVAGPDGPYRLRGEYLVGADGRHSATRELAGVDAPDGDGDRRAADRRRDRRVFLIGDAARHGDRSPGGRGLDAGLTDAFNLGWKLAAAIIGDAGPDLLDSYERERGATAPTGPDPARGDTGEPSELAGRLAPEMTLQTRGGPVRLAELTTRALPLLVDRTERGSLATALRPWHEEVDVVRALPGTAAAAPTGLFLRPDCLVAWASTSDDPTPAEREALRAAAERWLGPRST